MMQAASDIFLGWTFGRSNRAAILCSAEGPIGTKQAAADYPSAAAIDESKNAHEPRSPRNRSLDGDGLRKAEWDEHPL